MALNKYVITATTTVPAGIFTLDATTGLRVGTGSNAPSATAYSSTPNTFIAGTTMMIDTASGLFTCLNGLGVLRAYADTDAVGHAGLAN